MEKQRYRIDGAQVRGYRERAGLDQPAFAALVGLNQASLSNIETGKRGASPRLIVAIARELGVGFDDITIDTMRPHRPPLGALSA
jgi:transcriptional regulator with XRE-family HTH domain